MKLPSPTYMTNGWNLSAKYIKPKLPEKLGALFHQSRDKSLFFGNISVILLESKGQADRSA